MWTYLGQGSGKAVLVGLAIGDFLVTKKCLWRYLKSKKIWHFSLFSNNTVLPITTVPKHKNFQWIDVTKEKVFIPDTLFSHYYWRHFQINSN